MADDERESPVPIRWRSRLVLGLNFAWTISGRLAYAGSQWVLVILMTRAGGLSDVGLMALALAIANPIMTLAQLALRPLKATATGEDYPPATYMSLRTVTTLIGAAICIAVGLSFGFESTGTDVLAWIVLAKAFDNVSDLLYGFHLNRERHDLMSLSLLLRSVLGLVGAGTVYVRTSDLGLAMAAQAGVWGAVLFCHDLPRTAALVRSGEGDANAHMLAWTCRGWRGLARLGLPLGISGFLASAVVSVPRYFVESGIGREALGVFAAMAYFVTVASLLANSAAQTIAPQLGRAAADAHSAGFFRILRTARLFTLAVSVLGIVVAVVSGEFIVRATYGEAMLPASWMLPWLVVVGGLSIAGTFASYGLIAARMANALQLSLGASAAVCAGVSWFAVPRVGIFGAVLGWMVALGVQWSMSEWFLWRNRGVDGRPMRTLTNPE